MSSEEYEPPEVLVTPPCWRISNPCWRINILIGECECDSVPIECDYT